MYGEQVERMTRSCMDASPVSGQRTITHNPKAELDRCKEGRIANDAYRGRVWRAGTNQSVIEQMNESLGTKPEGDYAIIE